MARNWEELTAALGASDFRKRFRLSARELKYLHDKGVEEISTHAKKFVLERLAPAQPANDGKQTPFRNHPVFVAQHATATCCRGCLQKWHYIKKGTPLSDADVDYIVGVICRWLETQDKPG